MTKYEVFLPSGRVLSEFDNEQDALKFAKSYLSSKVRAVRYSDAPVSFPSGSDPITDAIVLNLTDTFSDLANDNSISDTDFSGGGGGGGGSSGDW